MKPFRTVTGAAAALPVAHIDTDQILPARYMKTLSRKGLGRRLFNDWRYDPEGAERDDFVLNRPEARQAQILVTYENFGCGSSREHAVWALSDFGIRALIAPSFGSIFATNCVKNGVLPVRLPAEVCEALIRNIAGIPGAEMSVDLDQEKVTGPDGRQYAFSVGADIRSVLLEGLDDISRTLRHTGALNKFEAARDGS